MSTLTHPPAVTPARVIAQALALLVAALIGVGIGFAVDDGPATGPATSVTVEEGVPATGGFDQDRANEAYTERLTSLYEMYRDREANPGTAPTNGDLP